MKKPIKNKRLSPNMEATVLRELKAIRRELAAIKPHVSDTVLTPAERKQHEQAMEEYYAGKAVTLKDIDRARHERQHN